MKVYALMAYHPADGSGPGSLQSLHRTVDGAKLAVTFDGGTSWQYYEELNSWSNGFFSTTAPYELED